METEDPREAIRSKDLSVRAAAARDLARHGGWDDLELLVELAMGDKSPSVRLCTAAAAADIVSRHRGAHGQPTLSRSQRAEVREKVGRLDPSLNPSVLMMLCGVADRRSLDRLGRMAKDLRVGVRLGVTTTLRRVALSAVAPRKLVYEVVTAWLADPRMPADVRVDLARLVGEAGLSSLSSQMLRVASQGHHAEEVCAEAVDRLRAREAMGSWEGVWVSDGLDIFEMAPEPRDVQWVMLGGGCAVDRAGERFSFSLDEGVAALSGEKVPMVWAPSAPGEGYGPTLLWRGRAWFKVAADELPAFVNEHHFCLCPAHLTGVEVMVQQMGSLETPASVVARGAAWAMAGEPTKATAALDVLTSKKKSRSDAFFWRGRALAELGERAAATEALKRFLDKAAKSSPLRPMAQEILGGLAA